MLIGRDMLVMSPVFRCYTTVHFVPVPVYRVARVIPPTGSFTDRQTAADLL